MKNISKNRFGFTLVELLAVIVILAIIAVIAVPSVLKIISGARNDSVKVSARSAIKAADLAATKGETEGDLTALDIDKNPFKGGSWYYDKTLKKVIIYEARDKEAIADSKYVITGDIEQINSDDFVVSKPANDNSKLLANKFKFGEFGYLTGVQINNYVQFGNLGEQPLIWRVVKLFEDKSVLVVTQNSVANEPYDNDYENGECTGKCTNNFTNADIKTYLNEEFLNKITNKDLLKYNEWDTSCGLGTKEACPDGGLTSTINKVGLLTLKDYLKVAGVSPYAQSTNYLVNGESMWWLGTGQNSNAKFAWIVGSDGYAYDNYVDVIRGLRPAVVLTPGITITNNDMTNIGSSTNPYTIE